MTIAVPPINKSPNCCFANKKNSKGECLKNKMVEKSEKQEDFQKLLNEACSIYKYN